MSRLFRFARRYTGRWLVGCLMLLLTNATALAIPQVFRRAIDGLQNGTPLDILQELALWLVALALVGAAFRTLSRIFLFWAARDVEVDLRAQFYGHLSTLDAAFFQKQATGDLISRATSDLTQVRLLLGPGILNTVNTVIAYAGALPLMLALSPKLTLLMLTVYPPALWAMRRLGQGLYHRNREQQAAMGRLSGIVQESLSGSHVVRAFGLEEGRARQFADHNHDAYDASIRLLWLRSGMFRLVTSLAGVSVLVAVYFGARDVLAGELSLGALVALVEYMALLSWPTFALGWVLSMWQRGRSSMARLGDVFDTQPQIRSGTLQLPERTDGGYDVRVEGLTITHPSVEAASDEDGEPRPALRDLHVRVRAGTTLGVVGPVGSGKSTLVRCLLRLLDVAPGQVFFGEHDITKLDLISLRRQFAYVPQEPGLFSMTLAQNVAFGRPDASIDEVKAALAAASFEVNPEMLPEGLDTPVGERGITLSGGQKQRVAIARALLLDPPVLLLDDALSSVDAETEAEIIASLRRLRRDRTTIVVAHRISAVLHADHIIVLQDGALVEKGDHSSLTAKGGLYAAMVDRQTRLHEVPEGLEPGAAAPALALAPAPAPAPGSVLKASSDGQGGVA